MLRGIVSIVKSDIRKKRRERKEGWLWGVIRTKGMKAFGEYGQQSVERQGAGEEKSVEVSDLMMITYI
jgi:hypothetical protein